MKRFFDWWGATVVRLRWLTVVAALAIALIGITWGTGLFGALQSGGFDDPGSESARTADRIAALFGNQNPDLIVVYSSDTKTVDDPAFRASVSRTLAAIRVRPEVARVVSYDDSRSPALISADRHATYAAITLRASDDAGQREAFSALRPMLNAPGATTQVGGVTAFEVTADHMSKRDVERGEAIAMPVVLVLLTLVFGGLVAAAMPLVIGGLAILGALTATRLISLNTDISTFAVNSITLLGLGMAIDYALLMINRYREELRRGVEPNTAVRRTVVTAGRTILISGLTVTLALASLLIFPQVFLRSMALGGMAAVLVAMLGALTVLPGLLALLGPRINAWRVPLPWPRRRASEVGRDSRDGAWARLAHGVMRRPVRSIVLVVGLLAILTIPVAHVHFGGADVRVLPAGTEARVATDLLATEFPATTTAPIQVLVDGASPTQLNDLIQRTRQLPGVIGIQATASKGNATLLMVAYAGERTSDQTYDIVRSIRHLPVATGVTVMVGGRPAADVDQLASLGARLPWMAAIMAAVTLVLLFFAFGSILLPVKAVLMNLISIGASFGIVVWIFQDGHLAGLLGFTPTGFIEPTIPILLLAVLFGLATDYEVFLLSRVREEWDATGENATAVATGLQRTGQIITAAALLLVAVAAGFTTSQITLTKLIGVGMIAAITLDATLVRTLLVPATMRLLGHWNWWAPGPLRTFYCRFGIEAPAREPALRPSPEPAG